MLEQDQDSLINHQKRETGPIGVTLMVAGLIAYLPGSKVRTTQSGACHWAFREIRDKYRQKLPGLDSLEFSVKPGVWPISERLERSLMVIDMAVGIGTGIQLDEKQRQKLRTMVDPRIGNKKELIQQAAKDLGRFIVVATRNKTSILLQQWF